MYFTVLGTLVNGKRSLLKKNKKLIYPKFLFFNIYAQIQKGQTKGVISVEEITQYCTLLDAEAFGQTNYDKNHFKRCLLLKEWLMVHK